MNSKTLSLSDRLIVWALSRRRVAFAINKCFRLGVEPIPLALQNICDAYATMNETCVVYSERQADLSWLRKRDVRLSEMELLRIIDFEATHYVLRRSTALPPHSSQMREFFLDELYTRPERYAFFQPRDTAVRSYASFGWLDLQDFTRSRD